MTTNRGKLLSLSAFGLLMITPLCSPTDFAGTPAELSSAFFFSGGSGASFGTSGRTVGASQIGKPGLGTISGKELAEDGGSTGVCCESGGICTAFSGNQCPSGTTSVSCPCTGASMN